MTYLDQLKKTLATDLTDEQQSLVQSAKASGTFANWTDQEIGGFVAGAGSMNRAEGAGEKFYMDQAVARREANLAASQDRAKMLSDLESFRQGYNEDWIAQGVAREKAGWDAKIAQTREQIVQQYAQMGRVADPLVMAEAVRRVATQASTAMQLARSRLEQDRASFSMSFLDMQNDVFKNTTRATVDPSEAAQTAIALGGQ